MLRNGSKMLRSVPQKLRKSFANENPTCMITYSDGVWRFAQLFGDLNSCLEICTRKRGAWKHPFLVLSRYIHLVYLSIFQYRLSIYISIPAIYVYLYLSRRYIYPSGLSIYLSIPVTYISIYLYIYI